ncbi:MAG: M23 family metallopeptidase [Bacteroidales bacterium]|nr:M23 family metallopeptidase [Candidatus Cryptobacteroides aphodequi]
MAKKNPRKYTYNSSTLQYEQLQEAKWKKPLHLGLEALAVLGLVVLYFWFYTRVLNLELPKTAHIRKANSTWMAKMAVMEHNLDQMEASLEGIEYRNDDVYRNIFGLNPIPEEVKAAGFGGANRYAYLDALSPSSHLRITVKRLDVLTKRAYVQSRTLDEVAVVSKQAENMVACVPAVPPILPQKGTFRMSSPFGYRKDPVFKHSAFHNGIDLATTKGNPVYATGNGVVERVRIQYTGYGKEILIDHGFGYKTRYAHLNNIYVQKGQSVQRGEQIGEVGNTGKSTGPHLHYEVLYKGKPVNPMPYMDLSMRVDEFRAMVSRSGLLPSPTDTTAHVIEDTTIEEYAF